MAQLRASGEPSVRALSRRLLTTVDDLAGELADRIRRAEVHYRRQQGVPADDLWQSCRHNLLHILTQLAGDAPLEVEAARATGRRRAEQGVPLPAILHAYRIGGRYVWDTLVAHAEDNDAAREALFRTAGDVWTIIDDYSEALIEAYRETIADQARHNLQFRNAALTNLLDGDPGDGSRLWESAAMLHLPHQATFVVVAAETPHAGAEALPGVEETLRRHHIASAWLLETERQVGVIAVRPPITVTKVCQHIAPLARGRVGVNEPYTHLDQSAAALRQARIASVAATLGTFELIRHEQHPIAVLLASTPELGRNVPARFSDLSWRYQHPTVMHCYRKHHAGMVRGERLRVRDGGAPAHAPQHGALPAAPRGDPHRPQLRRAHCRRRTTPRTREHPHIRCRSPEQRHEPPHAIVSRRGEDDRGG
jgi:GGDEF-like domain